MRNGLALLTLGLGWVLFGTSSCGQDEATGGPPTTGHAYCSACTHSSECASDNVCRVVGNTAFGVCAKKTDSSCKDGDTTYSNLGPAIEGSGGSGGSAGGGILGGAGKASAGKGGGGTGAGPSTQSNLGRACVKDIDCADANLTCVTTDGLADGSGPAKGLCTAACTSTSQCLELNSNSFCYPFTQDESYCVEGCSTGALGTPKCHEREEVACSLIGLLPQGTGCQTIDDCLSGELCDSSTSECGTIVTACTPICGGDFDCADNQKCDFASGLCSASTPVGQPLGSACTPATGNDPDPCNGFCLSGDNPDEGECSALCTLTPALTGCGWDGMGPADTACLFATVLSGSDVAPGDVGICGTMCDCNAQCPISTDRCVDESGGQVKAIWQRNGYCRPLQSGETQADTFSTCPAGTGGTSGTGGKGGSSGTGGDAGQSGAGAGGQGGA